MSDDIRIEQVVDLPASIQVIEVGAGYTILAPVNPITRKAEKDGPVYRLIVGDQISVRYSFSLARFMVIEDVCKSLLEVLEKGKRFILSPQSQGTEAARLAAKLRELYLEKHPEEKNDHGV